MSENPRKYMERALELALMGRGFVSPNPMVGAVIVKDGCVVAEGFHKRFGGPHAEVVALENAGPAAHMSTVYVTLEPCCHHGKTPPCTRALVRAGVNKVVMAMEDPNPRVAGKGKTELENAGIEVECGLLSESARKLNEVFAKYITTGLPFFIAKAAMTLDGKIATREKDSRWITGQEARDHAHWLRAGVDAVMVGSGTIEADNPKLTTRMPSGDGRDAIRIIIDGDAKITTDRAVFNIQSAAPTIVAVKTTAPSERKSALLAAGAEVIEVEPKDDKVNLVKLAGALAKRNVASVLIEGGGELLAAAFDAGIVDKVLFFVAPKILGGKDAPTPVEGLGSARVADAVTVSNMSAQQIGNDILIEGYVVK